MNRIIFIALFFLILGSLESAAQLRIDKKIAPSLANGSGNQTQEELVNLDTLLLGSIKTNTWEKYTTKFGKEVEFGVFVTLPDPGYPYRIVSWNLPFYGGGYQSGGLREAGLSARIWSNLMDVNSVVEDSIVAKTSPKSYKIAAFEYRMAEFLFSNMSYFRGSVPIGLSVLYESGPDSLGISPIWTVDKMVNTMFYSKRVPLTDSTSVRKYFNHTDFWNSYKVNPGAFGQLSGYLIIEKDTSKTGAEDPDDSGNPLGTSLNEKWFLPGSHRVVENFPNPFNPTTTLRIMPQMTGEHEIIVYDIVGKFMYRTLISARAGYDFNILISGDKWPSGVYMVSVRSSNYRWIHPITLVK